MMKFGLLKKRRKWIYLLEVYVQVMLVGRLITAVLQRLFYQNHHNVWFIVTFVSVMVFSEIVPFIYLTHSALRRLKIYKKARALIRFSETQST